jgi:hypothetical protein
MRGVLWGILAMALLGLLATFALESGYAARAQEIQLVTIDPTQHSPFGPATIDAGEPADLIVDDPKAFLKNKTAMGLPMVDTGYLKAHGEGYLALSSIRSLANLARIGCVCAAIFACLGIALLKRAFSLPPLPDG